MKNVHRNKYKNKKNKKNQEEVNPVGKETEEEEAAPATLPRVEPGDNRDGFPRITITDEFGFDKESSLVALLTQHLRVKVQTLFDDNYEGTVYSYDTVTNTVTLTTGPQDYRIMKISFLRDVTVVSSATPTQPSGGGGGGGGVKGPFSNAEPKIAPVSLQSVEGREKGAVRAELEKLSNKGVGVTQEAQDIYDALSRTMKCRWHGKNIIVMDMVNISEPYTIESCVAPSSNAGALSRVKKVLDGERKRLEASRRGSPVPANPAERKGG